MQQTHMLYVEVVGKSKLKGTQSSNNYRLVHATELLNEQTTRKRPFLCFSNNQSFEDKFERFIAFNNSTFHVLIRTYTLP